MPTNKLLSDIRKELDFQLTSTVWQLECESYDWNHFLFFRNSFVS